MDLVHIDTSAISSQSPSAAHDSPSCMRPSSRQGQTLTSAFQNSPQPHARSRHHGMSAAGQTYTRHTALLALVQTFPLRNARAVRLPHRPALMLPWPDIARCCPVRRALARGFLKHPGSTPVVRQRPRSARAGLTAHMGAIEF